MGGKALCSASRLYFVHALFYGRFDEICATLVFLQNATSFIFFLEATERPVNGFILL